VSLPNFQAASRHPSRSAWGSRHCFAPAAQKPLQTAISIFQLTLPYDFRVYPAAFVQDVAKHTTPGADIGSIVCAMPRCVSRNMLRGDEEVMPPDPTTNVRRELKLLFTLHLLPCVSLIIRNVAAISSLSHDDVASVHVSWKYSVFAAPISVLVKSLPSSVT